MHGSRQNRGKGEAQNGSGVLAVVYSGEVGVCLGQSPGALYAKLGKLVM